MAVIEDAAENAYIQSIIYDWDPGIIDVDGWSFGHTAPGGDAWEDVNGNALSSWAQNILGGDILEKCAYMDFNNGSWQKFSCGCCAASGVVCEYTPP